VTLPLSRVLFGARKEFWEGKAPAEWSDAEKQTLLGQSPWARSGIAQFEAKRKNEVYEGVARPGGGVPGAKPGDIPGGATSVPIGERPPPPPTTDTGQSIQFPVLARWENAKPVRLAGGPELPAPRDAQGTAAFYVIRLRGMPLLPPPNRNEGILQEIEQGSRIARKDKAPIRCSHLLTGSGAAATVVAALLPARDGSDYGGGKDGSRWRAASARFTWRSSSH